MNNRLAENIKYYRKQMGMTQSQLAKKLNGKKSLVCNYEKGYSTPDILTVCKLAKFFNITVDELIEYDDSAL